jgi:hypothetical protein
MFPHYKGKVLFVQGGVITYLHTTDADSYFKRLPKFDRSKLQDLSWIFEE